MSDMIRLIPIGFVRGGRTQSIDDHWGEERAVVTLDPAQFTPEVTLGLADFSHLEIVFVFHRVPDDEITTTARHPRGRIDWPKIGIFAQRGKGRPNRLGVSTCRLLRVDGLFLHVQGLDAIDGTPVLDVKPVLNGFLPRGDIREPAWATEIMRDYW